jgi:hypothetical protein
MKRLPVRPEAAIYERARDQQDGSRLLNPCFRYAIEPEPLSALPPTTGYGLRTKVLNWLCLSGQEADIRVFDKSVRQDRTLESRDSLTNQPGGHHNPSRPMMRAVRLQALAPHAAGPDPARQR